MPDIESLRDQIDRITLDLTRLLAERIRLASEIGQLKESAGLAIEDQARENEIRSRVYKLAPEVGLDRQIAGRFLNFLLGESIKVQPDTKQTHLSIFAKARQLEESGKKIIHMEVGQPDFMPPDIVGSALGEAYDKRLVKYDQPGGMQKLREAVAGHITRSHNTDAGQDNILVSPGARFAVYAAIETLLSPGDEIIVIEPAWPAYRDCAAHAGVKVRSVHTDLQNGWTPSLDEISNLVGDNTKMIVCNYPNNPTGKILPKDVQNGIVDIARDNDLYILSDEIYSQYAFTDWTSMLQYNYEKTIVTQSFSKSHAMTGLRIGYAVSSPGIIKEMQKLYALSLTSVAQPIQYAALRAIEVDVSQNAALVCSRLDLLGRQASKAGLKFVRPDGAMYIFARPDIEGFDGTRFSQKALEAGVAIAPGSGFGAYNEFIRISACTDESLITEGMNILNDILYRSG